MQPSHGCTQSPGRLMSIGPDSVGTDAHQSAAGGFGVWIERDVVVATGPDTTAFLQGQLAQDVEALDDGASAWSLLLQPAGKVDAWLRVTRTDRETFELDVDARWGEHVLQRLSRFKLRTKCELTLQESVRVAAVRGTHVDAPGARPIVWPGIDGVDVFGATDLPAPEATRDAYERARILAGVPAMGRELTDATIPVEAGQWLIDASVSFTKGCYTGQELVARVDSRGGNAPRPIRILRVDGRAQAGDAVSQADGKEVGAITSAAADGDATVALAPLLRTVSPGDRVRVDGNEATVVDTPRG